MKAQFRTACADGCGEAIEPDQEIVPAADGGWSHATCPDGVAARPADHGPLCARCFTYHRGECA